VLLPKRHTFIEEDHTAAELEELRSRLELLPVEQVADIAKRCGIDFGAPSRPISKHDYINVMDESYWDEMAEAYRAVSGQPW
jgi:hypothetical protein